MTIPTTIPPAELDEFERLTMAVHEAPSLSMERVRNVAALADWVADMDSAQEGLTANDRFTGDFDTLPFLSHIECGSVPCYPTSEDFQNAALSAETSPARRWKLEAIRFRLNNRFHGSLGPAELKTIALAVAKALHRTNGREES